ncbi:Dps family protein [Leeia oryzae]|uniref:Dps family protein n=1 Tax=Leeia oryzae TaxID=356662 RepID=UPI00036E67C9|nr:DNA starvation/stationary phase protection protein [Leeia oryzae]
MMTNLISTPQPHNDRRWSQFRTPEQARQPNQRMPETLDPTQTTPAEAGIIPTPYFFSGLPCGIEDDHDSQAVCTTINTKEDIHPIITSIPTGDARTPHPQVRPHIVRQVMQTDFHPLASNDITSVLNPLLADVFALYLKTQGFRWHMHGPDFFAYHVMLGQQAMQLIGMTDLIAERVRKVGRNTLRSIGHISQKQRLLDNDADTLSVQEMLVELREDNKLLIAFLKDAYMVCEEHSDLGSMTHLAKWTDKAEGRVRALFEASCHGRMDGT